MGLESIEMEQPEVDSAQAEQSVIPRSSPSTPLYFRRADCLSELELSPVQASQLHLVQHSVELDGLRSRLSRPHRLHPCGYAIGKGEFRLIH